MLAATVNAHVVGIGVGTVDAGKGGDMLEDVLVPTVQDALHTQAGGGR